MRLDVRPCSAEQFLGTVNGDLLDLIHNLATTVPTLARVALGVLVGQDAANSLTHGGTGEVLRGDQLESITLSLMLEVNQIKDWVGGLGGFGQGLRHGVSVAFWNVSANGKRLESMVFSRFHKPFYEFKTVLFRLDSVQDDFSKHEDFRLRSAQCHP